jgi:hypothetical protein
MDKKQSWKKSEIREKIKELRGRGQNRPSFNNPGAKPGVVVEGRHLDGFYLFFLSFSGCGIIVEGKE